jgi:replicative DNA helicase
MGRYRFMEELLVSTIERRDQVPRSAHRTTDFLNRQPPGSSKTEQCLLGSILLKPDVCDDVMLIVRPDDFYDEVNRRVYEQMLEMHDAGRKVDASLLAERLKQKGILEEMGGLAFLAHLADVVPHAAHATDYALTIRDYAARRELIDACTSILQEAYDSPTETRELVNIAEQRVFSILDRRGASTVVDMKGMLNEALDLLDARLRGEHLHGGIDTGFEDLDRLTGGLHKSELSILAARPGMGKTALALNITEHVAIRHGVPVLFVSLEMSAMELINRLLCSIARVDGHKLRRGVVSKDERKRIVDKASEISIAPLYVDDSPSRNVVEIAAAARRVRRRSKQLGLVIVDYLQLIEPDNPRDPRQEQVARITRRLKGLARELEIPLLCLAQLNRQTEVSRDNRPRLSHLRESGAIEQDADVVMFVHREEYYQSGEEDKQHEGEAEIIVAKQRNGPIGTGLLYWDKTYTRFGDRAVRRYDESEQFSVVDPM